MREDLDTSIPESRGERESILSPWDYLDSKPFRRQYISSTHPNQMKFYIEGVRCSKCLAKIEALKLNHHDIASLQMDMSKNVLNLEVIPKGLFSPFVESLSDLGFTPHPIKSSKDQDRLQKEENKSLLTKIGVAAFCTGNLMTYATSIYAGVDGTMALYFEWASLVIFLPVLFYSAQPFYKSLWSSIRDKKPTIDLPIVGAIAIGFTLSTFHLLKGHGDIYYDSLAVLVFLLLSSRFFLKKIQQSFLSSSFFLPFLNLEKVLIWNPSQQKSVLTPITELKVEDVLVIKKNDKLPADGQIWQGNSNQPIYINNALLTGESRPVQVEPGQPLYAGAELYSEQLFLKVTAIGQDTRLGSLFEKMEEEILHRTPLISLTDRLAQWFTYIILAIGCAFFAYYSTIDLMEATRRALALVILACPCALALATPLTQSLSLLKAAKNGFIIKKADVLERLNTLSSIAFDKTGTLTTGQFCWLRWIGHPLDEHKNIIVSLEKSSHHPIAKAFLEELRDVPEHEGLKKVSEILGQGVQGFINDDLFQIKSLENTSYPQEKSIETHVGLYKNDKFLMGAVFGDEIRRDTQNVVSALGRLKIKSYILSGDSSEPVHFVAENLEIDQNNALSHQSPESKLSWVKSHPKSMMVGDGANDAAALAASHISVAVHGSMEASLQAADVYLSQSGVQPIYTLILLGRDTMKVVYRNLGFSLVYNIIGGVAALMGYINPLVAAVLMPISSLIVLCSSLWGTRFLRSLNRTFTKEEVQ